MLMSVCSLFECDTSGLVSGNRGNRCLVNCQTIYYSEEDQYGSVNYAKANLQIEEFREKHLSQFG